MAALPACLRFLNLTQRALCSIAIGTMPRYQVLPGCLLSLRLWALPVALHRMDSLALAELIVTTCRSMRSATPGW